MNQRARTGFVGTLVGVVHSVVQLVVRLWEWAVSITVRRPPSRCAEIGDLSPGYHPNPETCNDFRLTAFDVGGQLMVYTGREGPETLVKEQAGINGFDAASRLESTFPPSQTVLVRAAHFGQPARIEAFAASSPAGMQVMASTPGVVQAFTFNGSSIDRVVVTPAGDTIVIEFCH
jgi:hypothetical protein